jgi:proteic killer suppression protein
MIKSFRHSGIASYFLHGKKNGIQPHHAQKLSKLLGRLNVSTQADDMNLPGMGISCLEGQPSGALVCVRQWQLALDFYIRRN